jgi:hypothetical protein
MAKMMVSNKVISPFIVTFLRKIQPTLKMILCNNMDQKGSLKFNGNCIVLSYFV